MAFMRRALELQSIREGLHASRGHIQMTRAGIAIDALAFMRRALELQSTRDGIHATRGHIQMTRDGIAIETT
jgi:hypothetical protein